MKPVITAAELARIRARHSDIPQPTLPGLEDIPEATNTGSELGKPKPQGSMRFARCPDHTASSESLTGVVVAAGTEVFRPHNKVIGSSGRRILCAGSGKPAPPTEDTQP
jgi:hypothetical protein